jgi:putative endonuclease
MARDYLERRGLQTLHCNYRCKLGEVDLIMQDGEELVFVEVRYRDSNSHGGAAATVTPAKQRRLIRTANHYLQRHGVDCPCRIDVVAIDGDHLDWLISAIEEC